MVSREKWCSHTHIRKKKQKKHTHFKIKKVTRQKSTFIMIKETICQDDKHINMHAPSLGIPKYIEQLSTDLKEETDKNTIIVRDLNTPLTTMDKSCKPVRKYRP